jgi:phage gp29-like protein
MVVTGGQQFMPGFRPQTGAPLEWVNIDEVIQRHGFRTYDEMRHDDQIKVALQMKTSLIASRAYDVLPATDSDKDKEIAQFLKDELVRIDFNQIVKKTCLSFTWGFSVAEIVWTLSEYEGKPAIRIKKLPFRDPRRMRIRGDEHGNLKNVIQEPDTAVMTNRGADVALPIERVFHYAYQSHFGNPYGESDLRSIYKNWWAKKYTIQFWNVFLERMGAPLLIARYPNGAPPALKTALKAILTGLSSKTEVLVPQGVEIEMLEAKRSGTSDYNGALAYHDAAIVKGILVPALLGVGEATRRGSDSQSRLHLRTLFKMADEISKEISTAFMKQVGHKLLDMNFDGITEYPTFKWGDYGEYEAQDITDAVRLLHAAGILELDGEDTNYLRSLVNLPLREEGEEDEVVRPPQLPPPGSANAPPPAAGQGNQRGEGQQSRTGAGGAGGGAGSTGTQS